MSYDSPESEPRSKKRYERFKTLFPSTSAGTELLELFWSSIRKANQVKPKGWGVTLDNLSYSLWVGQSQVLRIERNLVIALVHSMKVRNKLKEIPGVSVSIPKNPAYPNAQRDDGGTQGCFECRFPIDKSELVCPVIKRSHELWIKEAANKPMATPQHSAEAWSLLAAALAKVAPGSALPAHVGTDLLSNAKLFPELIENAEQIWEGALQKAIVNRYERDPVARSRCIAHFGKKCQVCNFDFEECYGEIGRRFIHIHHLQPLAAIGQASTVNPEVDLIPVCPNCHAMLHQKQPPYTITELQHIIGCCRTGVGLA